MAVLVYSLESLLSLYSHSVSHSSCSCFMSLQWKHYCRSELNKFRCCVSCDMIIHQWKPTYNH